MGSGRYDRDVDPADPFAELAHRFAGHYRKLRGELRRQLVARQLAHHLPPPPASVVDIGGGIGHQAFPLATAGYQVVLLDASAEMLRRAHARLADEPPEVAARMRLMRGVGEEAASLLAGERFDVVLCHAVLPYVVDDRALLRGVAGVARRDAVVSVLAKNGDALAMRPALQRRWREATTALGHPPAGGPLGDVGGMGVRTRAHRLADLTALLAAESVRVVSWYGIRVFTDHLFDEAADDLSTVLAAEEAAGSRDPYRAVARLLHVVGRMRG